LESSEIQAFVRGQAQEAPKERSVPESREAGFPRPLENLDEQAPQTARPANLQANQILATPPDGAGPTDAARKMRRVPTATATAQPTVLDLLTTARSLVAEGWISQAGASRGLEGAELDDFHREWAKRYQPTAGPDRDNTDRAMRLLATVTYGEPIPEGIPPIVILSNWNERPERTQAEVLAAYDEAIRRAEADRG
jgi:hypothetical protein